MGTAIPLSRLAKLVGRSRAELQLMAQNGELATFDGHVAVEEVLRAFPDARFGDDSELSRVEGIKDAALSKPERDHLPDPAILAGRLEAMGRDFARAQAQLRQQARVHVWLGERLEALAEDGRLAPETARDLRVWLARELAEVPKDSDRWQQLVAKERAMRLFSAQVTVQPKGIAFETRGSETLLQAGLRAGFSFAYGCSNGACGDCRARLVSGEVVKLRPHDWQLTEAEIARGVTLMCCYAPLGDVEIEATLSAVGDIPEKTIEARVRTLETLSDMVVALHLLTPRSDRMQFLAGQRVRLRIGEVEGEVSIASCPCEERRIELHMARGTALATAAKELRANECVQLAGPFGDFVLDDDSDRPLVFIAEGLGYAPIKALIQHALSRDRAPSIDFHWFSGAEGLYQEALPRSYADALDEFSYVPVTGAEEPALLALAKADGLPQSDIFAAGSTRFLTVLRAALKAAGVAGAHYHEETTDR